VHLADDLLNSDYVDFHFNKIPLKKKSQLIKRIYKMLENDEVFGMLSLQWQQSLHERNQSMQKLTLGKINQRTDVLDANINICKLVF
jgi:hypothetical protein